jgi:acyl-coenzyme A synthetase/AMP-(fatty) acid ligase
MVAAAKPEIVEIGTKEYRKLTQVGGMAVVPVASTDPAWIFYTGGTTGRPKEAVLSHRSLLTMALNYLAEINQPAPGEAVLPRRCRMAPVST